MMGLITFLKNRKINYAIKKTQNLMANNRKEVVVSLPGKKKQYEGYFDWLRNAHPDWTYHVDDVNGMIFVLIGTGDKLF